MFHPNPFCLLSTCLPAVLNSCIVDRMVSARVTTAIYSPLLREVGMRGAGQQTDGRGTSESKGGEASGFTSKGEALGCNDTEPNRKRQREELGIHHVRDQRSPCSARSPPLYIKSSEWVGAREGGGLHQ